MERMSIYKHTYNSYFWFFEEDIPIDSHRDRTEINRWLSNNSSSWTFVRKDRSDMIKRHIEVFPEQGLAARIWNNIYIRSWFMQHGNGSSIPLTWAVTHIPVAEAAKELDKINRRRWLTNLINSMKQNTTMTKESIIISWLKYYIMNNASPLLVPETKSVSDVAYSVWGYIARSNNPKDLYREFIRIWFTSFVNKYGIN